MADVYKNIVKYTIYGLVIRKETGRLLTLLVCHLFAPVALSMVYCFINLSYYGLKRATNEKFNDRITASRDELY
jgi:hypothetical protein